MRFAKLHALGNDFLLLDPAETGDPEKRGELTRRLCERRRIVAGHRRLR